MDDVKPVRFVHAYEEEADDPGQVQRHQKGRADEHSDDFGTPSSREGEQGRYEDGCRLNGVATPRDLDGALW